MGFVLPDETNICTFVRQGDWPQARQRGHFCASLRSRPTSEFHSIASLRFSASLEAR
jgi:hypothetical protein